MSNENLIYNLNGVGAPRSGVLTRMDLTQNTIRWMRTYSADDGKLSHVEGLALVDHALAVYARDIHSDISDGHQEGYFFVVNPQDGGHITTRALKVTHFASSAQNRWMTSSSAMYFDDTNNKVTIAWYLHQADADATNEGTLRVGQFRYDDVNNVATLDHYKEQETYFGQLSAVAYVDGDVYVGGAADNNSG